MKAFGKNLATVRMNKSLTQYKVADDLEIGRACLSHYETGIRQPSLENLIKIADYYNVSVDALLGRTKEK